MHYKSNKSKQLYFNGDILPAVFIFIQKKNYIELVKKQKIIEDKNKSVCIFLQNKKLCCDKTTYK